MGDRSRTGRAIRFLASGGFAELDPDIVRDLLIRARELAQNAVDDPSAPETLKDNARGLLLQLQEDAGDALGGE